LDSICHLSSVIWILLDIWPFGFVIDL
jgi:hypothetical protein